MPGSGDSTGQAPPRPVTMLTAGAGRTLRPVEEMRNSRNVWIESENAQYPLPELRDAYMLYLASRSRPVTAGTRERYEFDLKSFEASLTLHNESLVLDSLSPFHVERWLLDMREGRIGHRSGNKKALTPVTISTRLASLKTFSHKYIYRHLELSNRDVL